MLCEELLISFLFQKYFCKCSGERKQEINNYLRTILLSSNCSYTGVETDSLLLSMLFFLLLFAFMCLSSFPSVKKKHSGNLIPLAKMDVI